MRLRDSHNGVYNYPNMNLTSFSDQSKTSSSWRSIATKDQRTRKYPSWRCYSHAGSRPKLTCLTKQIRRLFIGSISDNDGTKLLSTSIALVNDTASNLNESPTLQESIKEQWKNTFGKTAVASVGTAGSQYSVNQSGFLICKASIDCTPYTIMPKSLQTVILHLSHYPILSVYSVHRRRYDMLCQDYYWPHVAMEAYQVVTDCAECHRTQASNWHLRHLRLFPDSGPL